MKKREDWLLYVQEPFHPARILEQMAMHYNLLTYPET